MPATFDDPAQEMIPFLIDMSSRLEEVMDCNVINHLILRQLKEAKSRIESALVWAEKERDAKD